MSLICSKAGGHNSSRFQVSNAIVSTLFRDKTNINLLGNVCT